MGLFKDCGCGCNGAEQQKKFTASILSGLLFFIIANPETFTIVRRIFGKWVASATGYPTTLGLLLHAVIFFLIVWGIMNLKKEKAEGVPAPMMGAPSPSPVSMMGPPPPPVPENEATPDGLLPPMDAPEQPYASIMTSPQPAAIITQGTMSKMSNMLGGQDITSDMGMAPAPPVTGTNWRQCACGDGTQVMILK
jgi:hypothetical protein